MRNMSLLLFDNLKGILTIKIVPPKTGKSTWAIRIKIIVPEKFRGKHY